MKVKIRKTNKLRRQIRVRSSIVGTQDRPRLSVFRSNKYISAQLIDDRNGKTLLSLAEQTVSPKGKGKVGKSFEVGKELAKNAVKAGIKEVVFDRGSYRYHGRVKAFADGAREGGLKF